MQLSLSWREWTLECSRRRWSKLFLLSSILWGGLGNSLTSLSEPEILPRCLWMSAAHIRGQAGAVQWAHCTLWAAPCWSWWSFWGAGTTPALAAAFCQSTCAAWGSELLDPPPAHAAVSGVGPWISYEILHPSVYNTCTCKNMLLNYGSTTNPCRFPPFRLADWAASMTGTPDFFQIRLV